MNMQIQIVGAPVFLMPSWLFTSRVVPQNCQLLNYYLLLTFVGKTSEHVRYHLMHYL